MSVKSSARIKKRRSGEPWVSNNRVLTGGNGGSGSALAKKTGVNVGRNPNFDTDETKLLIQLWGDPKLQRVLITTHKKHAVICQLAAKMEEYGYHRSPEEITTRIKNLKCFYNRLKKDMESGMISDNEPSWKHFTEMDIIMSRPIFSVRPNEIPAPSLKFQLEQAAEERRAERLKKREAGVIEASVSGESEEDDLVGGAIQHLAKDKRDSADDGIIADVEFDMDMSDETFAAIASAAEQHVLRKRRRRKLPSSANDNEDNDDGGEYEMGGDEQAESLIDEGDDDEEPLAAMCVKIKEEQQLAGIVSNNDSGTMKTSKQSAAAAKEQHLSLPSKNEKNTKVDEKKADTDATLIIPKEEPIDVDAEFESTDKDISTGANVRALMPTLADILEMSKQSLSNMSSSGICIPVSSITTIAAGAGSGAITMTTTTSSSPAAATVPPPSTATQGKISLVPTNFLMQPKSIAPPPTTVQVNTQPQTVHILPKGQLPSRIVLGSHAQSAQGTGTANANNAGIVATGPGGMKVLLVNADQATVGKVGGAPPPTQLCSAGPTMQLSNAATGATATVLPLSANTSFQQQFQQQQTVQQQQQQQKHQQQLAELEQKKLQAQKRKHDERQRQEDMLNKNTTGMRILLRQLLNAQTENNEIEHNRLSLERERLDWEKSFGERLLTLLPALFQQNQQQQQQQVVEFVKIN